MKLLRIVTLALLMMIFPTLTIGLVGGGMIHGIWAPVAPELWLIGCELAWKFSWSLFALLIWLVIFEKMPTQSVGLFPEKWDRLLNGFLLGVFLAALPIWLGLSFGLVDLDPTYLIGMGGIALLMGRIVQAGAEEIICRGWLLGRLLGHVPNNWAVGISTAFFVALHALNPGFGIHTIILQIVFSLICARFLLKNGEIWTSWGLHIGWNWLIGACMSNSGGFWLFQFWALAVYYYIFSDRLDKEIDEIEKKRPVIQPAGAVFDQ